MKKYIFLLLAIILLAECNHDEPESIDGCKSGCINISEIENRTDYYLPFSIVNDIDSLSEIILNYEKVNIPFGTSYELTDNGFYELILIYNNNLKANDTLIFTTKTEEREPAEWGIKAWIPAPFETSSIGNEEIEAIYPRFYTDNIKTPFIFYIKLNNNRAPVYLSANFNGPSGNFNIKQGVGSININAAKHTGTPEFTIGGKSVICNITKKVIPDLILSGDISEDLEIPANSFVHITGNLNIQQGVSFTVNEGTMLLIDEAVDINHSGPINFNGKKDNPIFVSCSDENKFWGGFLTKTSGATIIGLYTIFCQSGYHNSGNYVWGHAQRQALFYTSANSLILDHCYMLDHIGQIFYPLNSTLTLTNILVQRVKTSGQITYSTITIQNSIFTDFPDDSRIYADNDNDALYIDASNANISNSIFMFAKDDGLDSGGDLGGTIQVSNCRFEACFHEGSSLSSRFESVKRHIFKDCIFTNCGQGLELGFSSPNHTVIADNCIFYKNGIGVRYGDNYSWASVEGNMLIKNSLIIENNRDVWNMVRMIWKPKLGNLKFENTSVTTYSPQYPELKIISK